MPIDALRRFFRSMSEKEAAPKKRGRQYLEDTKTGEKVDIDPDRAEVAADLLASPLKVRKKTEAGHVNMTPAEIKEMAGPDAYRSPTDTELRRQADKFDKDESTRKTGQKLVRTGYGGGIKTGDGSYLKFGSDDPQPMHGMKKGGKVKSRSSTNGASSRGDGIAKRGKTKGRFV